MNKVEAAPGAKVFSALVSKIMSILKLDDAGKLEKFFSGEVKAIKNKIKAVANNKQTRALGHEMDLSDLDLKIEDAEEAVKDAYSSVTVEEISSNDSMRSFSDKYWSNIDDKELRLKMLVENRKAKVEAFDAENKKSDEKIAKYEARIAMIS